ncbi:MAG: hypothetical protein COU40_00795 [Candidatus Moranbacteria bacterium CG10_big_fil_rev_8_21_14_0_10_35_21]|nr:MAG: hypothetical protein COU40_00795 [Candidatus Moranbacteria bacterium CG10_big_fil_rev_8_21_14_0_10_35_21]PJA88282.1 MAG: hypothetical protein CO139_03975 [Candidatus Moranbacteria bacterium CG_4_9_14_3_um_filter_36_9]
MKKLIIGFAGEISSGKGTATKYVLEKHGGNSSRFSTMLRDVLKRVYIEETRENMQKLSTFLRQTFGEDLLAKVMSEDVKNNQNEIVVIDGIRRLADIEYLKKNPEFKLIYIDAEPAIRFERLKIRKENPDDAQKTFEQFQKDHEQEAELQIKDLKQQADYVIDNNESLDNLNAQIEKIISENQ